MFPVKPRMDEDSRKLEAVAEVIFDHWHGTANPTMSWALSVAREVLKAIECNHKPAELVQLKPREE
jgi:hypothetical protein